MVSSLPTLSIDGFVTNHELMMSKIFEYFLIADYSQSLIFQGDITSFKYIMATGNVVNDLSSSMIDALTKLYERYYDTASVEVQVTEHEETNTQYLKIGIVTENDGKKYYLYRSVQYTNGRIEKMADTVDKLWEDSYGEQ